MKSSSSPAVGPFTIYLRFTLEPESILLTCPAPQCTDAGWGRRRRCAGPPTSPARPAGTGGGRPPSWRTAPSDSGPRSQTWLWPQSAPVLQRKGHKPFNDTIQRRCCWACVSMFSMFFRDPFCARELTFVTGVGAVVHLVQSSGLTVGAFTEERATHGETHIWIWPQRFIHHDAFTVLMTLGPFIPDSRSLRLFFFSNSSAVNVNNPPIFWV